MLDRPGAVGGQQSLQVGARRGADKLPGITGQKLDDGRRVFLPGRFSRRDHGPRIYSLGGYIGFPVTLGNKFLQQRGIDQRIVTDKGRQDDGER